MPGSNFPNASANPEIAFAAPPNAPPDSLPNCLNRLSPPLDLLIVPTNLPTAFVMLSKVSFSEFKAPESEKPFLKSSKPFFKLSKIGSKLSKALNNPSTKPSKLTFDS